MYVVYTYRLFRVTIVAGTTHANRDFAYRRLRHSTQEHLGPGNEDVVVVIVAIAQLLDLNGTRSLTFPWIGVIIVCYVVPPFEAHRSV
jgi:hypothetical protein